MILGIAMSLILPSIFIELNDDINESIKNELKIIK
jgi:hypothetical protein